ncbi:MAG: ferrochelatase [Xanthomonadales bacterium]|nr:ferrochelatase [Xanthomonadales bacterium]
MSEPPSNAPNTGVLLANLGTPDSPERKPVARFLREFLSDPRVVDLPRFLWLPLLNLVIIPLRAGRSAAAYRQVWWPEGSPLLVLTRRLAEKLSVRLGAVARVEIGMRYRVPSILLGLENLKKAGVRRLVVIPLYPQFSGTTTASIYDAVDGALQALDWQPQSLRVQQYHRDPVWIEAVAASIRTFQQTHGKPERLVFSLHGIPQRYVRQGDPYADQCRQSAEDIAAALGLAADEWLLTFQSRVGKEPWLQPYTDMTLKELARSGVRHVQVVCPGFAVDCLETLEEIARENREYFEQAGGEKLEYIPALNDSDGHVDVMQALVEAGVAGVAEPGRESSCESGRE